MFAKYIFYITICWRFHSILNLDPCELKSNRCAECIQDPNVCVWCATNNFTGNRCRSQTNDKDWCPDVMNPSSSAANLSDVDFNSTSGTIIQLKPQSYVLKLRPGQPVDFKFTFKGTIDFPVDFYFLLDASRSMSQLKDSIANQSDIIHQTLKNMTKHVSFGLGTFIDKMLYPMTGTFNPNETYSFKHHLKLTKNFETFKKELRDIKFGSNLDAPESGLDALAQVIACRGEVGWSNESTKIVVLITDQPYHAAGDGKLAGLFEPYDGKCHTVNNLYTNELVMDYPSVGMINKLASDNGVIVIFFITKSTVRGYRGYPKQISYFPVYQKLSGVVSGSKAVLYNNNVSNKLDKVLENIYKDITKKIKLKIRGKKKKYEISFQPDCTGDDSGSECDVKIGQEQEFKGTIKLLQYDDLPNDQLDIVVEGFGGKLTLDVEYIKNCECEIHAENRSDYCHGEARECGICRCINRQGERCACEKRGDNTFTDNSTCIAHQSDNTLCSGHGSCFCGACKCRKGYGGDFCECNKYSCKWDEMSGTSCNGHGECECDTCKCEPEWTGHVCQCPMSKDNCKTAKGIVCNGRGKCDCGICKCDPIAQWDVRDEQDEKCKLSPCTNATNCHTLQCSILKKYALCKINEQECLSEPCPAGIQTSLKDTLSGLISTEWKICKHIRVGVGCYMEFAYWYKDKGYGVEIIVQKDLECAETYFIYGGICLLTLLVVCLGTLFTWKKVTENHYRREYKQFLEQHKTLLSELVNPLYKDVNKEYNNPIFRQNSVLTH